MAFIRWVLGRIILFLNFAFPAKGPVRTAAEQAELDKAAAKMVLYQYKACPFCVKVRRALQRQSLKVETRDAKRNPVFAEELVAGGGLFKVPCLRIEEDNGAVTWMYESSDIVAYLEQRFSLVAEPS